MGLKERIPRPTIGLIISGCNKIVKGSIISSVSKTTLSPLPIQQNTDVPGIIPSAVPIINVRTGIPKKAGTRLTNQNGNMGTMRKKIK